MSILATTQALVQEALEKLECSTPAYVMGLRDGDSINITLIPSSGEKAPFLDGSALLNSPMYIDYRVATPDEATHERAVQVMVQIGAYLECYGPVFNNEIDHLTFEVVQDPVRNSGRDSRDNIDFRMRIQAQYILKRREFKND